MMMMMISTSSTCQQHYGTSDDDKLTTSDCILQCRKIIDWETMKCVALCVDLFLTSLTLHSDSLLWYVMFGIELKYVGPCNFTNYFMYPHFIPTNYATFQSRTFAKKKRPKTRQKSSSKYVKRVNIWLLTLPQPTGQQVLQGWKTRTAKMTFELAKTGGSKWINVNFMTSQQIGCIPYKLTFRIQRGGGGGAARWAAGFVSIWDYIHILDAYG